MNRFNRNTTSVAGRLVVMLPVAAFVLLLVLFLGGVRNIGAATLARQQESLETALSRSISQCYAVEGIYPPDLEYLKAHYGLTYDESVFFVDYVSYGGNLRPEVTVLRRQTAD